MKGSGAARIQRISGNAGVCRTSICCARAWEVDAASPVQSQRKLLVLSAGRDCVSVTIYSERSRGVSVPTALAGLRDWMVLWLAEWQLWPGRVQRIPPVGVVGWRLWRKDAAGGSARLVNEC